MAAVGEMQALLLIDDQGQGELTEVVALLRIAAPLRQTGTAVEGMDEGVVVGRIIDQELLPQGEALAHPAEQLALDEGKVVRLEQVHVIPEALAAQLLGGRGYEPGEHRPLVPLREGPLACGPDGAVDRGKGQVVAHRQRRAPARWGWRHMGVDQIDKLQVLHQGIEQGRGPKLPGLHGLQRRGGPLLRGTRALGTKPLQHPLSGAQINLLDNPRLAVDAGRAHPIEVRFIFFPFGDEA